MDKIEFKIEKMTFDNTTLPVVSIFINDKNLIETLKEYELPFALKEGHTSIAGGYCGMEPKDLYQELTNPFDKDSNSHTILSCGDCGLPGCWPMTISMTENNEEIIWQNFQQPHRNPDSKTSFWDYSNFPVFKFNKESYNLELEKIKNFNNKK